MVNEKTLFIGYLPCMYIEIAITVITRFSGVYGEGPFVTCRQAPRENGKQIRRARNRRVRRLRRVSGRDGTGRDGTGRLARAHRKLVRRPGRLVETARLFPLNIFMWKWYNILMKNNRYWQSRTVTLGTSDIRNVHYYIQMLKQTS